MDGGWQAALGLLVLLNGDSVDSEAHRILLLFALAGVCLQCQSRSQAGGSRIDVGLCLTSWQFLAVSCGPPATGIFSSPTPSHPTAAHHPPTNNHCNMTAPPHPATAEWAARTQNWEDGRLIVQHSMRCWVLTCLLAALSCWPNSAQPANAVDFASYGVKGERGR